MALRGGIDGLRSRGDLERYRESEFRGGSRKAPMGFGEVQADLPAPTKGAVMYVIADNGAGKRALRVRFPTGAVQTISTEP